ncbi:MAG: hypothetical protein A2Y38_14720 [Spirochaetes bacterium GWB1_59_5]|nr:MAG: hypothetical protein A2Y38_14720 [Spirochaetes bacterium GWB1_59_5]
MTLLTDWKSILTKAWSVRFIILAGLLSGIEVALQIIEPTVADTMPKGVFASLSGLATAAALVARVIAQNGVENGEAKK